MGEFRFNFGVEKLFLPVTQKQEHTDKFDYPIIKASHTAKQPQSHHTAHECEEKSYVAKPKHKRKLSR